MKEDSTIAIVLAAGLGSRMGSELPKVLHPLARRPMLSHVFDTLSKVLPDQTVLVTGPDAKSISEIVSGHSLNPKKVIQKERLGTAHAVMAAKKYYEGEKGTVLIIYGDTPLLTADTIEELISAQKNSSDSAVVVLGFKSKKVGDYGRLILNGEGKLEKIVEANDATPDQLKTHLFNSGVMAIDAGILSLLIKQVTNDNVKGEYYLTDIVEIAIADGRSCAIIEGVEEEVIGINSKLDLAEAEAILQERLRKKALKNGTMLLDPSTVYFSWDTILGQNVTINPNVFFGPGVKIGDDVEIHSFSHLEGANVSSGSVIGPFARLRPGADIGRKAHIGNFVEVKNSVIADGVKANHLSYIGDAKVGENSNIGAGTITCNYDGNKKSITQIGEEVFIGSNTALVAPVKIGNGAVTGAGSVITKDVEENALALTRTEQNVVSGWSTRRPRSKGDS